MLVPTREDLAVRKLTKWLATVQLNLKREIMKTEIVRQTKKGKLIKYTYTKGINIGEWYYILFDSAGDYLDRLGFRDTERVNNVIKSL